MSNKPCTNQDFVSYIMERIHALDEMGGPESYESYIDILEEVKEEIEGRIGMAIQSQEEDCEAEFIYDEPDTKYWKCN